MPKQEISAKELISDVAGGMTDSAIMEKYGLSPKGLQSAFTKLLNKGLIQQSQLDARASTSEKHHVRPVINARESDADIKSGVNQSDDILFCPKCGQKRVEGADFCGRCGNALNIPSTETAAVGQSLYNPGSVDRPEKPLAETKSNFTCPACGTFLDREFEECPVCGIVLPKFRRKINPREIITGILTKCREVKPFWVVAVIGAFLIISLGYKILVLAFGEPTVIIENYKVELAKSGEFQEAYKAIVKGTVRNTGNLQVCARIDVVCDECSAVGNPWETDSTGRGSKTDRETEWARKGIRTKNVWSPYLFPGEEVEFERQAAVMDWAGYEPTAPRIQVKAVPGGPPKDLLYYVRDYLPKPKEENALGTSVGGSTVRSGPSEVQAEVEAEWMIKGTLHNPRSARFMGTRAQDLGGGRYLVTGEVEATNAFNATIRNPFSIIVRWTGGDNWVAE